MPVIGVGSCNFSEGDGRGIIRMGPVSVETSRWDSISSMFVDVASSVEMSCGAPLSRLPRSSPA